MTIQEMLDKVDLLVPNTLTDAQKVGFFNAILRDPEVIKYCSVYTKDTSLSTVASQEQYTLPTGYTIDKIKEIYIANETIVDSDTVMTRYKFRPLNELEGGYQYFNMFNGTIGLYPIPATSSYPIYIYGDKKPTALSTTVFTGSPDINEDYHDLLVYGCCKWVAVSMPIPDTALANNYANEYQNMMNGIIRDWVDKQNANPDTFETEDVY